jgi:hypothetical protein
MDNFKLTQPKIVSTFTPHLSIYHENNNIPVPLQHI